MALDPRTVIPADKVSIRTRIVNRIIEILQQAPYDADGDPSVKLFDIVKKGNIDDISRAETPGCAVEEGQERLVEQIYMVIDKTLRIYFNFKTVKVKGVDGDPIINYYFGRIVELFVTTTQHFADTDGTELALDIAEGGNSIQQNGINDPEPGGILYLDIDYRHARGNWTENR